MKRSTPPDQGVDELIAHLATTDARKDPDHANSIMKMAQTTLDGLVSGRLRGGKPITRSDEASADDDFKWMEFTIREAWRAPVDQSGAEMNRHRATEALNRFVTARNRLGKPAIHKALSSMIRVEEIGSGLPPMDRSFQVRLHTEGSSITLTSYSYGPPDRRGDPKGAATSARQYFVDQIADAIWTTAQLCPDRHPYHLEEQRGHDSAQA